MLRDWFLPRSIATQVKWSGALNAVSMEKAGEPMQLLFGRVDKIVSTVASLGVCECAVLCCAVLCCVVGYWATKMQRSRC